MTLLASKYMSIIEIEATIFQLEEIRIVFRLPQRTLLKAYVYERKYKCDGKVKDWLEQRVYPLAIDEPFDVVVIRGDGTTEIGPQTEMETIRDSYVK